MRSATMAVKGVHFISGLEERDPQQMSLSVCVGGGWRAVFPPWSGGPGSQINLPSTQIFKGGHPNLGCCIFCLQELRLTH